MYLSILQSFIKIQPIVLEIPHRQAKSGHTDEHHSQKQYISPVYWGEHIINAEQKDDNADDARLSMFFHTPKKPS